MVFGVGAAHLGVDCEATLFLYDILQRCNRRADKKQLKNLSRELKTNL